MHVLVLESGLRPSPPLRPVLRSVAASPCPALPGLAARHWRVEDRSVRGRYLFEDRSSLEQFAADPAADPAVRTLLDEAGAQGPTIGAAEDLASADVFDRPVFVVAAPRAGSTLLYDLLSQARELWTVDGESHGIIEGVPGLHPADRGFDSHRLTDLDASAGATRAVRYGFLVDARDRAGRRYLSLPVGERPPGIRLLEKTPENSLRIPFLEAVFPDARYVFLHRDARQSISSLIEAWRHGGFVNVPALPGWPLGHWCFLLPPGWRSLGGRSLSDVAAFQWYRANEVALNDLDAVPRERWTVVEYGDLVTAPESVVRRVCEFAGVEVDGRLADVLSRPPAVAATTVTPPSPVKWRHNPHLQETSYARMGPLMGRLRNLSTPATPPRPRPPAGSVRFSCFLHEIEVPRDRLDAPVVHPSVRLQHGTVPLDVVRRAGHRERFLEGHPILWVDDPATSVLYPYWARRGEASVLRGLRPGRALDRELPPGLSARLAAAGVLIEPSRLGGASTLEGTDQAGTRERFARDRWTTLPGLVHPAHLRALARYYRDLIASGTWGLGDDQVARRHGWYDEPVARFFHFQLRHVIGRVAGEPVKPTYTYSSAYHGGAALRAHLDRRQCEYTVSLLIDHSPGADARPWPLWFDGPRSRESVRLELGDAVLFRGCELPHWRDAAPPDQEQTMLLFHYVPADFRGVLH